MTPEALRRRMAHRQHSTPRSAGRRGASVTTSGAGQPGCRCRELWHCVGRRPGSTRDSRLPRACRASWSRGKPGNGWSSALTGAPGGEAVDPPGPRMPPDPMRSWRGSMFGAPTDWSPPTAISWNATASSSMIWRRVRGGDGYGHGPTRCATSPRRRNATQLVLGASARSRLVGTDSGLGDQPGDPPVGADRRARDLDRVPTGRPTLGADGRTARSDAAFDPGEGDRLVRGARRGPPRRAPRCRRSTMRSAFPGTLLVLLLAPVAVAMLGGLLPALVSSLVAFLLADWFFIEPIHSMNIRRAGDGLALVVFVAVSSLVSFLVDAWRGAQRTAGARSGGDRGAGQAGLGHGPARRGGPCIVW